MTDITKCEDKINRAVDLVVGPVRYVLVKQGWLRPVLGGGRRMCDGDVHEVRRGFKMTCGRIMRGHFITIKEYC